MNDELHACYVEIDRKMSMLVVVTSPWWSGRGHDLVLCLNVPLPVGPLPVVGVEVEPGVVPGRGVADVIREPILLPVAPVLLGSAPRLGLDFGNGDILLPMGRPEQLRLAWVSLVRLALLANAHAVQQGHEDGDEPEHKDHDSNVPIESQ